MIALLFPGQGSQQPGMGADLAAAFPEFKAAIEEAGDVLGMDIARLMTEGGADELQATENAQVVVYTMSCALMRLLDLDESRVACVAGHSLGELSAATAAGALTFQEGLRLVRERSSAMGRAAAATPGTMTAVLKLTREQVEEVVAPIEGVWVANHNGPEQTVIAGTIQQMGLAESALLKAGSRRVVRLPVSGAFHSPAMSPAASEFRSVLASAELADPHLPMVANTDASIVTDAGSLRNELARQIDSPVEWVDSVRKMHSMGATLFVEIGPGRVLSGLVKRILPDVVVVNIETAADLEKLKDGPAGGRLTLKTVRAGG